MKKIDEATHVKAVQASGLNNFPPRRGKRGRKILNILLCPLLTMTLFQQTAKAQGRIGYVFEVNGEWVLNGQSRSLTQADSVLAGGTITFRRDTFGSSYIFIADLTGRIIRSMRCDREDCSRPIPLPKSDAGHPSGLGRVFSAVMSFWRRSPEDYYTKIPRAGGILEESVVTLKDGRVDLSSVFKNKTAGSYLLRIVSKGRPRQQGLKEVVFDWDRTGQSRLPLPTIKAGLYEIQLLSLQDRERLEPGEEVWVLILPPGKSFNVASDQFKKVVADTAQWNAHELEESRRSFLRAYLGYLNAQKKK